MNPLNYYLFSPLPVLIKNFRFKLNMHPVLFRASSRSVHVQAVRGWVIWMKRKILTWQFDCKRALISQVGHIIGSYSGTSRLFTECPRLYPISASTWFIQALKKRVIKIGRKNKTEDGQVETESQPDEKDDKKNLIFPTKTKKGIFARLRK